MRQKMIARWIAILLCTGLLLALNWYGFSLYVDRKIDLRQTYVAAHDILPRQRIAEADLQPILVPQAYLQDQAINQKDQIIGCYTDIQGMIPAGSLFYRDMIQAAEQMPDNPAAMLKPGQAAYSLAADLATAGGNTIIPGQRADLYVSIGRREETPVADCLFRSVRVIAIRDHKGLDISNAKSTGIPFLVTMAVSQKDIAVLSVAEQKGTVRLIASSDTYDSAKEAVLNEHSAILPLLAAASAVPAADEEPVSTPVPAYSPAADQQWTEG